MPPPASLALLPAYERSLRAIVSQAQRQSSSVVRSQAPRAAAKRSVPGKDFLQRLREAGL